jgi:RHS repeat-associated protein
VGQNTTTYSYDPASNLATVTYPNGLQSSFTYDDLNRLKSMNGYTYQFGPTGNRTSASEPSGRAVNWTYDGIYRLTNETISLDPHSNNGTASYGLDSVGNRTSQTSSLPGIPPGNFSYEPDDRLSTETYDNNGNTLVSGARTFVYDFENRLKSMTMNGNTLSVVYDGDGNLVAKTASGAATRYLVDDLNPTGYEQVVEELVGGALQRTYTYGLQRINQNQLISGKWTQSFYGYDGDDGGGTVRLLTDITGTVTDTYDFDAWGNAINTTGTTPNLYLYRGEQWDGDLGLYYLRARHYSPLTGRFLTRDPEVGDIFDPSSLHKYLYASNDPVNRLDPSGRATTMDYALLGTVVIAAGVTIYEAEAMKSVKCIWCEGASQLATGLYVDLLAPGVRAVAEVAGRTACAVAAVVAVTDPWWFARKRSDPISIPVPRTVPISGKKYECTEQELETCTKLYTLCIGRSCGTCARYCRAQCHWPTHRPQCMRFQKVYDPGDAPPVSPWKM